MQNYNPNSNFPAKFMTVFAFEFPAIFMNKVGQRLNKRRYSQPNHNKEAAILDYIPAIGYPAELCWLGFGE